MDWALDNTAPLECCEFQSLDRRLGVRVSQPFLHRARDAQYVDHYIETLSINTRTFGKPVPAEEAETAYREGTKRVIADLDRAIAELTMHRQQLAQSLSG